MVIVGLNTLFVSAAELSLDQFLSLDVLLLGMILPNHSIGFKMSLLEKIRGIKDQSLPLNDIIVTDDGNTISVMAVHIYCAMLNL